MPSKITYKIKLRDLIKRSDIDGLSQSQTTEVKEEIKKELGEFVVDRILEYCSKQQNIVSVNRKKQWDPLSKKYREEKKEMGAFPGANMELTGSMLSSLESKPYRDGIEVGIFNSEEAQKADNHNKFSAKAKKTKVPKRQFIPNKGQNFKREVREEMQKIVSDVIREYKELNYGPENEIEQEGY